MSLGAVRPDDWNLPLLLHVLGAMVLVALVASVVVLLVVSGRASDRVATLRFAFRTLLLGAIPAYILMRATAEWIASNEDIPDDSSWLVIGYSVADGGLVLLIIATILAGLAARRARLAGQGRRLVAPATALMLLLIAAYAVALWAMVTKPA
jgi:hypothetical protein